MMRGYFNFRVFSLLESILKVDPDFLSLIERINDKGDPVAKFLYSLVSKDIKTNANYLKVSDKNDDLKFVNDTQVKRFIDAGQDPFDRASNIAKIGRTVRQILTSNGISVADQQIEKFVNSYKNEWDRKYKKESEGFNLISGEDIRNWYLEEKYVPGGGQLNSSCMRYRETQEFLDIYTNNPEVCQLLILVDNSNRLLGRALLWKLIDGTGKSPYYLDRIYTRFDSDSAKFVEWFEDFIKTTDETEISSHYLGRTSGCRVQLKKWKFEKYPYMDTFSILSYEDGILMTYDGKNDKKLQFHIQNTDGEPSVPNFKRSEKYDMWIHRSDAVYVNSLNDYIPTEYCVKDYQDNWIWKEESVYSDYYKKYVLKGQAVELEGFGLVDENDIIKVYDEYDSEKLSGKKNFLSTLISGSDYVRIERGWRNYYVNKKIASYDVYRSEWILMDEDFNSYYTNLYKIDDDNFRKLAIKFDNFDEVNVYYNSYGIIDKYTKVPLVIDRQDEGYVAKEVLDAFNLTPLDGNNCMKSNNFYRGYASMIYQRTIEILNKQDIVNKEPIISLIEKANSYLTENNSDYNNANKAYPNLIKYGSYTSYFNTEIANKFKEFNLEKLVNSKVSCDRFVEFLKRNEFSFSYIHDEEDIHVKYIDENLYDQCMTFLNRNKDVILFYAYWYILFNDLDYANIKFKALLVARRDDSSYSFRQLVKYYIRYEEVSEQFSEKINSIRQWFDENFNYSKLLDENNTSRGSEEISVINKIYNDFLEKLNNK